MVQGYRRVLIHLCSKEFEHWKLEHVLSLSNGAINEITLISSLGAVAILKSDEEAEDKKYHLEMAAGTLIQFLTK